MNRKELIYVENISPTSSEQNLQSYLERFAPVQAVYFLREKQCTKRSIAAFVRVVNATDRDIIMQKNQQNYRGKRLFMLLADQQNDYKAEHTVIVRNITTKISEEILYEHFETCGTISFLQIRTDDFAYVAFEDKASVRNAMSKNNQPLKGSSLKIQVLTRNLDIMIVNLDTLASRMPDLHRKMVLPVEPRAPTTAQQQQQPAAQPQSTAVVQPQQQSQPTQQRQQPPQSFAQNQQQQPHPSRHQQQLQQQLLQQRENQLRKQQQQAEQQRVQQAEQQRLQQQQQMLQQQKPLPQRQQNQQQSQARSEDLEQQQQKLQSQIQMLKEKANVLAGKQQQHQLQQQQQQQQSKSAPAVRQQPMQQEAVASTSAAVTVPSDTDDVQIVEVMETQEIIEDDDDDMDVQIVDKPLVEPTPSEYKPKPDDIMRPVKASEMVLKAVPTLKSEDDRRCVWVNNIQPETRRIDLVRYMEQFGDVVLCKVGNSNNCAFTRWAKVMFTSVDAAERAAEYFLHPFQGRYLFVLQCSKFVVEEPGKVFAIDYLSKYLVYEDVVKAFKHIGEVVYLVRLYDNNYKVRIFFLDKVVEKDVLAVDSIGGHAVTMEPYIENMPLKLAKPLAKELKEAREVLSPEKEARLAKVVEIYKQEALDRYATRDYTNPDPKTSPVEVVVYNVPKTTTETQIRRFFKSIGEPTAIRREPNEPHPVCEIDRVYVGFRTLSMAMEAAEIPPERTLNSYNPFIFTAWTQPAMTDRNTLRLFFSKYISIQNIYNGLIHCGPIKYIEKQVAKRALVVFGNGQAGVENAKQQNFIGDNKITGKEPLVATKNNQQQAAPNQPAIVIDDEDEVVVVPSNDSPKKKFQKGPTQQHQRGGPQNRQQQQQQQQQQQHQRPGGNRNRNSNSFGDGGPPARQQQFHPDQQRNQRNAWQNNNQGPMMHDQFQRREPFQRRDQFPPNDQFQFQQNQNQFMPNDGFNPGGPFDGRFGNQGPGPNMNMNNMDMNNMGMNNMDMNSMNMNNMNMSQFEQMMMAQQFDSFNMNNSNDGFNRGNPMESDDPPLDRQRQWGQRQQNFQPNFDRFSPPRQRSPFDRGGFPDDRIDEDQGFGRDSPGIPPNIPDDEIDEYILRKQEAIKRRLEQLDKQLISSVETSRQRDFEHSARQRRQGTVFSDNGDVHYVPNPAAVARFRGRRGGGVGGRRGGRDAAGEGPSRTNQDRLMRGRREREDLNKLRRKDPFADVDIVPIIRISEERSPSPKRSREDEFDTAQFDAAWN